MNQVTENFCNAISLYPLSVIEASTDSKHFVQYKDSRKNLLRQFTETSIKCIKKEKYLDAAAAPSFTYNQEDFHLTAQKIKWIFNNSLYDRII